MDIDELTDNFIAAFDAWANSPDGVAGELFEAMVDARQALFDEQEKVKAEKAG